MSRSPHLPPGQQSAFITPIWHASQLSTPSARPIYAVIPSPLTQDVTQLPIQTIDDDPHHAWPPGSTHASPRSQPSQRRSSIGTSGNPVSIQCIRIFDAKFNAAPQDISGEVDRSDIKRLHLAVYQAQRAPRDVNLFVWAFFVCTDGELDADLEVTLYTIVQDQSTGAWVTKRRRRVLRGNNELRLVFCAQFPTTEASAPYLELTLAQRLAAPGEFSFLLCSYAHPSSQLLGSSHLASARWACSTVEWFANQPHFMEHGMPRGPHVAVTLWLEVWQAALVIARRHHLEEQQWMYGALSTEYPFPQSLNQKLRSKVELNRLQVPTY